MAESWLERQERLAREAMQRRTGLASVDEAALTELAFALESQKWLHRREPDCG